MIQLASQLLSIAAVLVAPAARVHTGPPTLGDDPPTPAQAQAPADDPFAALKKPPEDVERADGRKLSDFTYSTVRAIELFEARVAARPDDEVALLGLAELYERKAHEDGDLDAYARAEATYRKALAVRPNQQRAMLGLAGVLCDRHKFAEGLAMAEALLKSDPDLFEAIQIVGDADLEIGRYDQAEAAYQKLLDLRPVSPAAIARKAHLAELHGRVDEAVALLGRARELAMSGGESKAEVAWYAVRLGDLAAARGRLDEAEAEYRHVPEGVDPFHDATFGLGRIAEARGDLEAALVKYREAVAIGPDLAMLAALGDLLAKLGRIGPSEAAFDQIKSEATAHPELVRGLIQFRLDHDRDLPEALRAARREVQGRKDIQGLDLLAWALHKNGRDGEAARAMTKALALGTRDHRLRTHAGLIALANHDPEAARAQLRLASEINPEAAGPLADAARAALDELDD